MAYGVRTHVATKAYFKILQVLDFTPYSRTVHCFIGIRKTNLVDEPEECY